MPTPIPLPASCSVEALAEWLWTIFSEDVHPGTVAPWSEQVGWRRGSHERQATAVRALVEAKVREAVIETAGVAVYLGMSDDGRPEYDMERVDGVVSRILGTALDANGGA